MKEPIRDKKTMYTLLAAGELGNTVPQWFDAADWFVDPRAWKYEWWGVRSMTPGGPCKLNCHRDDVFSTGDYFQRTGHSFNISPMIDKFCTVTAWLELWDSPSGLVVEGIEYPDTVGGWTWRNSMPDVSKRRQWHGTASRLVLRRHLNANSYDDVLDLLQQYPDHVVELSATDKCFGTVPHRNHFMWEVRQY
jgi:hypothetical protein